MFRTFLIITFVLASAYYVSASMIQPYIWKQITKDLNLLDYNENFKVTTK